MTTESNFIREPESEYRAQSRSNLSSHSLADFRRCPLLYKRKHIDDDIANEDTPAYLLGRAAHTRILEGELKYYRDYAIGGPINPKTGKPYGVNTNAFAEWSAAIGKPVLTDEQSELIANLAVGFCRNTNAVSLIADGIPEAVVRAEYCGMPCQSRIDFYSYERGIIDLKTCEDINWFEADAKRYGYAYQMAFYRSMVRIATSKTVPVHFIAVEKREPFRCGVWRVDEQLLDNCESENAAAIERLKRYIETDVWPTGFEEVRVFDPF